MSQRVSIERAVALAEHGELNLALSVIERVLLEQRDSPSAHALHGWLLSERGSHDGALAAYRKALYLEDTMLLAHAGAAAAARRSGVLDVARRFESRARTLAKIVGEPQLSSTRWEERLAARLLLQLQSGRV